MLKSMRKKIYIPLIVLIILVLAGVFLVIRYWPGIKPAIAPPDQDIGELINNSAEPGDSTTTPGQAANHTDFPLKLPDGLAVSIFADGLEDPRVIRFDPRGTMLISEPDAGRVVALPDKDNNGQADRTVTVIDGLNNPHGLAFGGPSGRKLLYIAETHRVATYEYDPENYEVFNQKTIIDLPDTGGHFTRTIMFSPEGELLVSVGSRCNACAEEDWRRAKILASSPDGSNLRTYASGLRNAVFMTTRPGTENIWATEMGRDYLGDNLPPDEINIIREDNFYGWPYCYGKNIQDTEFDSSSEAAARCGEAAPSRIDLQAHSAPLGLAFVPETGWPEEYAGDLLVAYHGSWNRTVPTGYKIVRFDLDENGEPQNREDFITGWLQENGSSLGRPVDINIRENGAMYVSDDKDGLIYQMEFSE